MNKTDFIGKVAESIGADTKQATSVVNTVLGAVTDVVVSGDSLAIPGFGTSPGKNRTQSADRRADNGARTHCACFQGGQTIPGRG